MTVRINKPAINLREELASLRNQGGLPKEDKLYVETLENGDFSNGLSGWSNESEGTGTATVVNGELVLTRTDSSNKGRVDNKHTLVTGRTYKLQFEVVSGSAQVKYKSSGTLSQYFNGENWNTIGVGVYTTTFIADGTDGEISIMAIASGTHKVDNVRLQEVGENLVTNGTFDTDSFWTKGTGWTISGGTASCDGSQTGNTSFKQSVNDSGNIVQGKEYTLTFTLSGHSGGGVNPHLRGDGYGTNITGNGTYTINLVSGGSTVDSLNFYAEANFVGSIDNVILTEGSHPVIQSIPYGYDVKDVYIDGELAREGEAYDYQVQTDGINQWLKPTVEPTATTETVVIGVRK
jgi:hypothetical protein